MGQSERRPRVAAIVTEWRENSHADVIVGKYLDGCRYPPLDLDYRPRVAIASLYTDQVPERDLSREYARRHQIPIFPTITEALTLGGRDLAVDGVLLIAEHGNYPFNEKGQHLYPRRRFFEEAAAVVRRSGRPVPFFNDKHLSYRWEDAWWMYRTARELKIPFMAGSSLPLTWRRPPLELPREAPITAALAVGYGGVESYGFHALETLQCMVERRRGGERGLAAVQCLSGEAVWQAGDRGEWSWSLLQAALSRSERVARGMTPAEVRRAVREPVAFMLEYRDGLRAAVLMLDGLGSEFLFAARLEGQAEPVSTLFWLQEPKPFAHFALLCEAIERMMLTGQPTYPVERTLLTTGALAFLMDSRFEGGARLQTPDLGIRYRV